MSRLGIRGRVILAAVLPIVLVVPALSAVVVGMELAEMEAGQRQRGIALARQIGSAAEFPFFTGDTAALQAVLDTITSEPDVKAAGLLGVKGELLAQHGPIDAAVPAAGPLGIATIELVHPGSQLTVLPVYTTELPLEHLFDTNPRAAERLMLGYVAIELFRERLVERQRELLLVGILATLAGLMFGSLIALWLSQGVTRPILAVFRMIERFGRGQLSARVAIGTSSPLRALEEGINRMAERIERGREELERRIAEATRELRERKEEAERANAAKSRFLATASHDLRQPIHALRLLLESLRDEVEAEGRAGLLIRRIAGTVDSTASMFDALLDISKLDAGVIEKHIQDIPVQSLLHGVELMFSPIAIERRLRFSVVRSSAWVRTDMALAGQVLQNLVSNALKYTHKGGVLVGCRRRQNVLSVEVWDTGPGIAPQYQQEIFHEFFQLRNAGLERTGGLGLGLAIVQRIAKLLDHRVIVRSRVGGGSMFAVELPYGRPVASLPAPQIEGLVYRFDGFSAAVLDDDEAIVDAMLDLLPRWGFSSVIAARSYDQLATRLAQADAAIDIFICDYRLMNGANGVHAVEMVSRMLERPVPAIIITGDTSADRLKEVHGTGLCLLHKPVSPGQLRAAIWQVLRHG